MRAILLAAGMGSRLRPLTLTTPKSLTIVNGKPLAERQIEFLREKGIDEIIIVTGYLNEKFEYLKEKYGVKLIYNDKYNVYNNIYTMYLVKEYLQDAYVIDADVYISNNFIDSKPNHSTYFSAYKKDFKNEWEIEFDDNRQVTEVNVKSGDGYILSGVSYWSKKDGETIVRKLEEKMNTNNYKDLYWDDIVKENITELDICIKIIGSEDIYEIDSIEELEAVKEIVEKR